MGINEVWIQLATVVGPTAAIAIFALWLNHQLMMKWTEKFNQLEENNKEVAKALGEVTEALRRLNGKAAKR